MPGMDTSPLQTAITLVGLSKLARGCNVSHQAVRKWQAARRMPRTEWTGETDYSVRIAALTGNAVTREALMGPWPALPEAAPVGAAPVVQPQQQPGPGTIPPAEPSVWPLTTDRRVSPRDAAEAPHAA